MRTIIVIGAGGHARVVVDVAKSAGFEVCGIIDINYLRQKESIINSPVIGGMNTLKDYDPESIGVAIALGKSELRSEYFIKIQNSKFKIISIISPTAIISKYVKMGKGVFVNAGAIISAEAIIGNNTIINSGAIVEHEVKIGKDSHVGPGVKIGGRTTIGDNTFIGLGATIIDNIKIGNCVTIGAGSVIINDLDPNTTMVGIPGRPVK